MSHLFRSVILVIAFTIASTAGMSRAVAQDSGPILGGGEVLQQLPELQSGVLRTYAAGAVASPASEVVASPVAGEGQISAAVLTFADDAKALGGMTKLQTDIQGDRSATALIGDPLGDKRAAFSLEDEAGAIVASTVVIQTGADVVVVLIEGALAEQDDLLFDVAAAIVDTAAGADAAQFAADGTSTGGQWDRLPAADDAALTAAGVTPVEDVDLQAAAA